jgi:hypothetical protein
MIQNPSKLLKLFATVDVLRSKAVKIDVEKDP